MSRAPVDSPPRRRRSPRICAARPTSVSRIGMESDHDALPPGTWISMKGVRRFIPADPTWSPTESAHRVESVLAKLAAEPPMIPVPEWRAHRHICECGCLLFGIENCPQCEWISRQNRVDSRQKSAERSA